MLVFSYRNASTNAMTGLFAMLHHTSRTGGVEVGMRMHGNALIHRSRNAAIGTVDDDSDFVLMVDDDMLPDPSAVLRLLEHNVPVVSAFCTTRVPPVKIAAKKYDRASEQFVQLAALRPNKLVSGEYGVGGGFLLIRRDVILALREYYLTARDWLEENRRTFDRLHVRADHREKERARKEVIRRANWQRERYLRVFDNPVIENELELGEDISFSRKCLELGIPIAIDTAVSVAHIGDYTYGVWDLSEEE